MINLIYFNSLDLLPTFCRHLHCTKGKHCKNQHIFAYSNLQQSMCYTP